MIYVSNFRANSVAVFAQAARGNEAPVRTIAGARTGLSGPHALAVDTQGNLYVANRIGARVTVYASMADGDVAPVRTLRLPNTTDVLAVAVGPNDDIFVSTRSRASCGGSAATIFHFAAGSPESDRTIAGPRTGLTCPVGLAFDECGLLFVANAFGGVVSAFDPGAIGDMSPVRSFTAATSSTRAIACGRDTLLLTGPAVYLYAKACALPARPAAVFARSRLLQLAYAEGIAIEPSSAAPVIYVADQAAAAIQVIQTSGVPPQLAVAGVSVIQGNATLLDGPAGVLCTP